MKATSTLCTHAGAFKASYADLKIMHDPEKLGRIHTPVRHDIFVDGLREAVIAAGLVIRREDFAIMRGGAKLFGIMDFESADKEMGACMGFRHGNDRSMRIKVVAGLRVFVCDNMALSGDQVLLNYLHTKSFDPKAECIAAVSQYLEARNAIELDVDRMRNTSLSDGRAKELIYDAIVQKDVLPLRLLPEVDRWYFRGELEDVAPRSVWGLHNAFTRTLKSLPTLNQQMAASSATTKALALVVR